MKKILYKKKKKHKEIHDEVVCKEVFLDAFNRLVKIENDMKKWVKEAESHKKKDKEEKDAVKVEIEKLKVGNVNLKNNSMTSRYLRKMVKYAP